MDTPAIAEPERRRGLPPFGILAVAVLRLVNAVGLIAAALELGRLPIAGVPLPWADATIFRSAELLFAGLTILGVVGLLLYKRWGWVLTMVLVGVGLFGDLLRVWLGQPTYLSLLLHVLAAFYLNGRSVRAIAGVGLERDQGVHR